MSVRMRARTRSLSGGLCVRRYSAFLANLSNPGHRTRERLEKQAFPRGPGAHCLSIVSSCSEHCLNANFSGADLSLSNLRQARLEASDFSDARLVLATVVHTRFTRANLARADFRGADLLSSRHEEVRGDPLVGQPPPELIDEIGRSQDELRTLLGFESVVMQGGPFRIVHEHAPASDGTFLVEDYSDEKTSHGLIERSDRNLQSVVWYGTNRKPINRLDHAQGFLSERDKETHFGRCLVRIPRSHRVGDEWFDDAGGGLSVEMIEPLSRVIFAQKVRQHIQEIAINSNDAVVFIHGYNTTFIQAIIRAAQLRADLKIPTMAVFSWPSKGSFKSYAADAATIDVCEQPLTEFLSLLSESSGAEQIHVIAHSMGNRAATRSIANALATVKNLGQVVMAAADVDQDLFKQLAPEIIGKSVRATLYASDQDAALKISGALHEFPRAGYLPPITVVPGIDTIDVSGTDLSKLGHGYISTARTVLRDVYELLHHNTPPDSRFDLMPSLDGTYWQISR